MTDTQALKDKIAAMLPPGVDAEKYIAQAVAEWNSIWENATPDQRDELDMSWRGVKARELSYEGWTHFYWCMTRREYPEAHRPVAEALINAVETQRAKMVMAYRGFGKSTDLVLFVAWMVGVRPSGSTGIVRINDTKAQLTGDLIAEMIEMHKGWKACFPNVLPDKTAGWSSEKGYNVIDTNVTGAPDGAGFLKGYSKWRQMCLSDHPTESSLMSAGIESGNIIGWHPTNGMYFDDLHDEKNTRSAAEMQKVVDILENNIIPTWFTPKGKPILGCVCTPWDSTRDAYHSLLQTGLFDLVKIPVFEFDEAGEMFEPLGRKVRLTWPEAYPLERVVEIYNASRTRFYRMYLLDDEAAKELGYVYRGFPAADMKWYEWPVTAGVDPTASVTGISKGKGKSNYAIAHVYETPYNSLVVAGGYVKHVTSDVGESALAGFARTRPNYRAASIETNNAGAALAAGFITRNPGLRVHTHNVSELGHGSKKDRQFKFLESLLSNGLLLVLDGETGDPDSDEYLRVLKSALNRYPNINDDEPEMDALDALCMAVLDLPRVWTQTKVNVGGSPVPVKTSPKPSPVRALGSYSYFRSN